ncbi:MAG: hypothetical protein V4473_01590 [Patescibacteria group bacterium]
MTIWNFFKNFFGGSNATNEVKGVVTATPVVIKENSFAPTQPSDTVPRPKFQTEWFGIVFEGKYKTLKNEVDRLKEKRDEIMEERENHERNPSLESAEWTLRSRKLLNQLGDANSDYHRKLDELRELNGVVQAEEKQSLLNEHLTLPLILEGKWKANQAYHPYEPRPIGKPWQEQRRIYRKKKNYLLVLVIKEEEDLFVKWVSASPSQMTDEELQAIIADQQPK